MLNGNAFALKIGFAEVKFKPISGKGGSALRFLYRFLQFPKAGDCQRCIEEYLKRG